MDLQSSKHAAATIYSWISCLQNARKKLLELDSNLDIKSTAWVAGFPILNAEIFFSNSFEIGKDLTTNANEDQAKLAKQYYEDKDGDTEKHGKESIYRDFIGPSIDIGFRLSALATPRKMVVSLELAWILYKIEPPAILLDKGPDGKVVSLRTIFFEGRKELKGVHQGSPYPVFWIDVDYAPEAIALNKLENKLNSLVEKFDVAEYCETFIAANTGKISKPFILGEDGFGLPADSTYPRTYKRYIELYGGSLENDKADNEQELREPKPDDDEVPPSGKAISDFLGNVKPGSTFEIS